MLRDCAWSESDAYFAISVSQAIPNTPPWRHAAQWSRSRTARAPLLDFRAKSVAKERNTGPASNRRSDWGYTMTAGYIGNRHPRLHRLLHHRHLLLCGISTPALDPGKHFNSINTVRHSRKTRRTPSSYLMRLCPVQIGAAPPRQVAFWISPSCPVLGKRMRSPRILSHLLQRSRA